MSFDYPQIEQWIGDVNDVPVFEGPSVPEFPDRLYVVTIAGGAGFIYERLFEQVMFQVRTRGAQNSQADARQLAHEMDKAIVFADFPFAVDDYRVLSVTRTGGPPTPVPTGNEEGSGDAGRQPYTCTYLIQVST